jgi:hypothetical protein
MDITALTGNLQALAMLYGWVLVFAAVFAVGERVCGAVFRKKAPPAADGAKEPAKG